MKIAALVFAAAMVVLSAPVSAQSNDDDYTPLNSRIKRARQFPTEPPSTFARRELSGFQRQQSRSMASQFAFCLFDRSNEKAYDLLGKTDYGFVTFQQIGLENDAVLKRYAIETCLDRVAESHGTGVNLSYGASSMRRWMLQGAYLRKYAKGPTWIVPDNVVEERTYPLSATNQSVRWAMDVGDCVVATDPYLADFFFRTATGSAEEKEAVQALVPVLGPCVTEGMQVKLTPDLLREWIGEGLWQAANHNVPAPPQQGAGPAAPGATPAQ
ncbi:MAG: hypothetical protein WA842_01955 [Croceibacterium sp.]